MIERLASALFAQRCGRVVMKRPPHTLAGDIARLAALFVGLPLVLVLILRAVLA